MPAESAILPVAPTAALPLSTGTVKCSRCGGSGFPSSSSRGGEEVVVLDQDVAERICAGCCRAQAHQTVVREEDVRVDEVVHEHEEENAVGAIGLGLRGMQLDLEQRHGLPLGPDDGAAESERSDTPPPLIPLSTSAATYTQPDPIQPNPPFPPSQTQSPPSHTTRSWGTSNSDRIPPSREESRRQGVASPAPFVTGVEDRPSIPLLDVTRTRVSSQGRGALYPGSIFKGSQTSGRSAYDVEVRFIDVNFPESTVSGYLSISHLTDTHPHLTTFFTGEIIGPKYGFITGSRFGATEHDDMRHWGRFEQFRRPQTRADMLRPELLLRDPGPDRRRAAMGETRGAERDFVFLRIKERFLVPDHTVRDISGASFAGFYFAMIDLAPSANSTDIPPTPTSPSAPKSPALPSSPQAQYFPLVSPAVTRRLSTGPPAVQPPPAPRRMSSTAGSGHRASGGSRSPATEIGSGALGATPTRRRRESNGNVPKVERDVTREATIRGYYFHSLNQEPFQELFLTHVPNRSSGAFEVR